MFSSMETITPMAFEVAIWMLLGLAVLLTIIRTFIKVHKLRGLRADDPFIFFTTASLIASTVILHLNAPHLFRETNAAPGLPVLPFDTFKEYIKFHKLQGLATASMALTVWSSKVMVLLLLRSLIPDCQQLRAWTVYWFCVMAIIFPSAIFCTVSGSITCPLSVDDKLAACVGDYGFARQRTILIATTVLDTVTGALLISLSLALIWRVKTSFRHKAALGAVLSLIVLKIIISSIGTSLSGITSGHIDMVWITFWEMVEAAVAFILLSAIASKAMNLPITLTSATPSGYYPRLHSQLWNRNTRASAQGPITLSARAIRVRTSLFQRVPLEFEMFELVDIASTSGETLVSHNNSSEGDWPLSEAAERTLVNRDQSDRPNWPLAVSMV